METNRDARVIAAVRALGDDRVIAGVRAARDAYAATHGHDIAAIFEDVRAFQETSGREYVRNVERLAQAAAPIAAQVSEAARQMVRSLGPALEALNTWSVAAAPILEEFNRLAATMAETMERFQPALKQFHERKQTHDALDEVGWLPHPSVPYRIVEGCGEDLALLDSRIAEYYRTQWIEIRDEMTSSLAEYHIDDEARATFREALTAHEAGLYRCVCRLLFPEIERMIGAGRRVGSRKMLQKLTDSGDPRNRELRELFDWVMLERLRTHAYAQVEECEQARFERDPVPNRHAAMHGLVAYSTHKHSMNMLILTDYVFRILRPIEDSHT
ncbi:MAG: hypothetical protein F4137_13005 [Acidobacteria bacterium]|nr:hypothetical protein [Acidobacteriota bacterium]